jgi:cytochrome c oxidase cbb3-type subunit 3
MSVGERDPHTGHMTTGHEWNGIKELNTKVPNPVWFFLTGAFLISFVMWFLLPTWPLINTYTRGILKVDERAQLKQELLLAKAARSKWTAKIISASYEEAKLNSDLMEYVRGTSPSLFRDNCAACHGAQGAGGSGYPNITDKAWLWGNEDEPVEETIMETLRVGINSRHSDERISQMPSFGRDGTIDRKSINAVISYIKNINERPPEKQVSNEQFKLGEEIFVDNCADCHGEDAKGSKELGAPDLTDTVWIYGSDRQTLYSTIWNGRQGHMPSWEGRLSQVNRKLLTFYILDLNAQQQVN